ncbi:unnamed protein product [Ascophyllum nodosum]
MARIASRDASTWLGATQVFGSSFRPVRVASSGAMAGYPTAELFTARTSTTS